MTDVTTKLKPGFLPICQNQIQGLFKDFQGPYNGYIRRTKLNQTSTFISIYKCHKLPQWGPGRSPGRKWILCTFEVRKKPSATTFFSINWFGHGVLENQIQALSRARKSPVKRSKTVVKISPSMHVRTAIRLRNKFAIQSTAKTGSQKMGVTGFGSEKKTGWPSPNSGGEAPTVPHRQCQVNEGSWQLMLGKWVKNYYTGKQLSTIWKLWVHSSHRVWLSLVNKVLTNMTTGAIVRQTDATGCCCCQLPIF